MIDNYLAYVILALSITAIPGPAVILTINNSLKFGVKTSIANISGNFLAMTILAALSAIGLGALLLASSTLYLGVKILGCIYLLYLGIKLWITPSTQKEREDTAGNRMNKSYSSAFIEGLAVGLSNPKAIVFFTALFPQFINPNRDYFSQFLTLILTIEGISFLVLSSYALLANRACTHFLKKGSWNIFNKLAGGAFIGFGAVLLYKE